MERYGDGRLLYLAPDTHPPYNYLKRVRFHQHAEVLITMRNAGVNIFPCEKPDIFHHDQTPIETEITHPTYYTSIEIKAIGVQGGKIRNSRATGLLLTKTHLFQVFNTGSNETDWNYSSELRLKSLIQIELCQSRLCMQYQDVKPDIIVSATDMEQFVVLMGCGSKPSRNHRLFDGDFEHVYYLTNDRFGEILLRFLCDDGLKTQLDDILMQGLHEKNPHAAVVNDGYDESGRPVLLGYTCDMARIKKFDTGLALNGLEGVLICFDVQEEAMQKVCGKMIELQAIDFEAVERGMRNR